MQAVLLYGARPNDSLGERARAALTAHLAADGYTVTEVNLPTQKIGNCAGDFFCWMRSPGVCNVADDNRPIAAAMATADLLVYLTPITFGGYAADLKRMVDHQIQNIAPFFTQIHGETHHTRRYARYPDFLVVGWHNAPNPATEAVFRHLAWRNALNFYAPRYQVVTFTHVAEVDAPAWVRALHPVPAQPEAPLPVVAAAAPGTAPQRAVLLVGSPRTRKSTSHAWGSYLMERLAAHGVATETVFVYTALNNAEKMRALLAQVHAADLVVLAFPVYVDSLPAPVITLLERLAAPSAHTPTPVRLVALSNCGFPEVQHNATALAVCAQFAQASGMAWGGSLALGAGEGLVHGTPLAQLDGRAIPLKRALDVAASALAAGQAIPAEAQANLNRPFIPAWLYRLIGSLGWHLQARRYGMAGQLGRQPYIVPSR